MTRNLLPSMPTRWLFMFVCSLAMYVLLYSGSGQATDTEPALEDLFGTVHRSVVLVRTRERTIVDVDHSGFLPFSDQGSGVLISADGDVLTAAHLVQVADRVQVEFADGTKAEAKIVASEPVADLALLKLERVPESAIVAQLGDSDAVRIGQPVFVIGAPYGLSHTLTAGRISGRHLPGTLGGPLNLAEFFQADVPVHRGNSGGPMFDMNGNVIGIVSHFLSQSGAFEGLGFSVTSNSIKELLLKRPSPWSGISVYALDEILAGIFNLPQSSGLLVQRIASGSPGAKLGLQPGFLPVMFGDQQIMLGGDIILAVDQIAVGTLESYVEIRRHLADISAGQTVVVRILRQGQILDLSMSVEE